MAGGSCCDHQCDEDDGSSEYLQTLHRANEVMCVNAGIQET